MKLTGNTKPLFIDVMALPQDQLEQFINKHSPNMKEWQKQQALGKGVFL